MIPFDGSVVSWATLTAAIAAGGGAAVFGVRLGAPILSLAGSAVAAAALAWAATPALAQDEAAELVRQAQARGRAAEAALKDWAAEVGRRGDAYRAEARALADGNAARLRQGFSGLEAGDLFGVDVDAEAFGPARGDEGIVYVAVSFSMEPAALRALAAEAQRAGAVMVVRGLVGGSAARTLKVARTTFDEASAAGLAVDPQVFRAFDVERVPTFIAAAAPIEPCEGGVDCTSPAPAHDRLSGNLSLAEALRLLAAMGQNAPGVAHSALARMER